MEATWVFSITSHGKLMKKKNKNYEIKLAKFMST